MVQFLVKKNSKNEPYRIYCVVRLHNFQLSFASPNNQIIIQKSRLWKKDRKLSQKSAPKWSSFWSKKGQKDEISLSQFQLSAYFHHRRRKSNLDRQIVLRVSNCQKFSTVSLTQVLIMFGSFSKPFFAPKIYLESKKKLKI